MNHFKRAYISITRKPFKSIALFFIVLLLGTLASGAISVSQAIRNTEINLLRRIPPVSTIDIDMEAHHEYVELHGEWPDIERLSSELFETIGNLPYVRAFDFAVYGSFFSTDFILPTDTTPYLDIYGFDEEVLQANLMFNSYRIKTGEFEHFLVKGVHNPNVIDMEEGIIELTSGRIFTQDEMENSSPVAILPQALAYANNLDIGSTFTLEMRIYDTFGFTGNFIGDFELGASLLVVDEIEFEVIGIFEPTVVMDVNSTTVDVFNHIELNTRIYVPLNIATLSQQLLIEHVERFHPESLIYHYNYGHFEYRDVIFALYDSLDLIQFNEAAQSLLPEFWMIRDLTDEFTAISNSMAIMQDISNWIVIGTSISTFSVLGLLIILLLRDRKEEIGIYLALGAPKKSIMTQIFTEVITISMVAIFISLFMGNIAASEISYTMLRQDLVYNPNVFPNQDMSIRDFNSMGYSIHMTGEDMLEAYNVSLDLRTTLIFYGVSTGFITSATVIPLIYILKLNPKDILLKGAIG